MEKEEMRDFTQILLAILKKEKGNIIKMKRESLEEETNKIKAVEMKITKNDVIITIEER